MHWHSIKADIFSWNSTMSACCRAQQWQVALELLVDMQLKRLNMDQVTLNTAVSAYETTRHWQGAMRLLDEGRKFDVLPLAC